MQIEIKLFDTKETLSHKFKGQRCVIGRSSKADICLKREELSRTHLQIENDNGEIYITDLNSANGVTIDGHRIQAGVRILYNAIFPIEIAETISITISQENVVKESSPVSEISYDSKSNAATRSFSSLPKRTEKTSKEDDKEKNSKKYFPLIFVVGILGIGYYLHSHIDNKASANHENPQLASTELDSLRQRPANISPFNPRDLDFNKIVGENQCSSFSNLCEKLELNHSKEGLALLDNKMFVIVNLEANEAKYQESKFNELNSNEKAEIILARTGTHPSLIEVIKNKQLTHLIVIGIDHSENLKYMLNIDYKQLPAMDGSLHGFVFSDVFQTGSKRLYTQYIGFYAKLDRL